MLLTTWNSTGPRNLELELSRLYNGTDVLLAQETWLPDCEALELANQLLTAKRVMYTPATRKAATGRYSGGTLMCTRKDARPIWTDHPRLSCCRLMEMGLTWLIFCVYSPPRSERTAWDECFNRIRLLSSSNKCDALIIGGDFNCQPHSAAISDLCNDLQLKIYAPTEPTFIGPTGTSTIDYFLVSDDHRISVEVSMISNFCLLSTGHLPVLLRVAAVSTGVTTIAGTGGLACADLSRAPHEDVSVPSATQSISHVDWSKCTKEDERRFRYSFCQRLPTLSSPSVSVKRFTEEVIQLFAELTNQHLPTTTKSAKPEVKTVSSTLGLDSTTHGDEK